MFLVLAAALLGIIILAIVTESADDPREKPRLAPTATSVPPQPTSIGEMLTLEEHCTDQWMWLNTAGKYANVDTMSETEWLREFTKINDRGMKTHDECGAIWARLERMPHETACFRDEVDQWMSEIEPILADLDTSITVLGDMFNDAANSPSLMQDRNWRNNVFDQLSQAEQASDRLLHVHFPSTIANSHYGIEDAARSITMRDTVLREAIAESDMTRLAAVGGLAFTEAADHFRAAESSLKAYQLRCG